MRVLKYLAIYGLCVLFLSCGSAGTYSGGVSLETALRELVQEVESQQSAGTAAVLSVSSASRPLSDYLAEELDAAFVESGRMIILDRANLDLRMSELDFQHSGEVSDETAQSIGKMLGVELVVTGTFTGYGNTCRFRIRAIQVESSAVVRAVFTVIRDDRIRRLAESVSGETVNSRRRYVQDTLFPVYGVTLGKTTVEEMERLGVKNTASRDGEGIPYAYYTIQGIPIWYENGLADRIYIVRTQHSIPMAWRDIGFSWALSYDEWIELANHYKWAVNVTQNPRVGDYSGKDTFSAKVEFSYLNERGRAIIIELDFNYRKGTRLASDRNTLYGIRVSYEV